MWDLALPLASWVALFKPPNLFEPQVPPVTSGDIPGYLTGRCANESEGAESLCPPSSLWPSPRGVSC